MFDLSKAKIIGREPVEPVSEEPINEEVIENPVSEEPKLETPASEEPPVTEAPKAEEPKEEVKTEEFPAEKFGGKFKSWEEVNEVLNKPVVETPKYDDFLQKVINKYQSDGDLTAFFKANAVDYDKMSDDEVVKRDFFAKNSDLPEKAAKKLWDKELAKYSMDDPDAYDEDDIEIGKALLKREADKLRQSGKEEQSNYLQPTRQEQTIDLAKLAETVNSMPEVQKLKSDRKVSFSVDGNEINYELSDPDFAISTMSDEKPFHELFMNNGRPDAEKWAKVMEFAKNPEKILKTVLDQGIAMGQKLIEKEIKNPTIATQEPEKFSGSTTKERFWETVASKAR